jgi:GNAT superfamily N-acetyltransferase
MADPNIIIREINGAELNRGAEVIRESFKTVASELGLTRENMPNHPSFMTAEELRGLIDRGIKFFGLFLGDRQIGSVAVEAADDGVYFLQKLAVLPEYRNDGYGRELVNFVIDYVKHNGCQKLALGIWDRQAGLKNWYLRLGFTVNSVRDFEHLPLTVCLMDMEIP